MQKFLILFLILTTSSAIAQEKEEKITPKELSIPTSPLFDLLGVAPSQVARTADIKDFKVDWSFKSWRVNPNLAIQAQPVWEIFYNKKNLDKYQRASSFARKLSSLDLSVGTVSTETGDRRLGGAVKLNLYKQVDPLLIKGVYDDIQKTYDEEHLELRKSEAALLKAMDTIFTPAALAKAKESLRENDIKLASFYARRNSAIQEKAKEFLSANWNAAYVDIAFGKIYTYGTDSAGSLTKMRLNRNTANGAWLNFGFGIGKRALVSGLVRSSFYEEELTFTITDDLAGTEETARAIAGNSIITIGANFRYGGPIYNFFIEFIHEKKALKTPVQALNEVFTAPNGKTVVSSTVNWDIVQPYTLNFGGDWRISRNVILNYGIRCVFDQNFKTTSVLPIANISCMMR